MPELKMQIEAHLLYKWSLRPRRAAADGGLKEWDRTERLSTEHAFHVVTSTELCLRKVTRQHCMGVRRDQHPGMVRRLLWQVKQEVLNGEGLNNGCDHGSEG